MKISTLRNKADKLYQQSLTEIYKSCEVCGKPATVIHHFFPKASSSALRYDEDNGIPCCVGCHLGFHSARSAQFHGIIINKRGLKWFNDLNKKRYRIIKPNAKYYQEIINFYSLTT